MTTSLTEHADRRAKGGQRSFVVLLTAALERWGLLAVFVIILAVFSITLPATYPTLVNVQAVMLTQSVIAVMALAAMVPAIVGQFDVSIGYQLGLSQSITAICALRLEWNPAVASVIAIASCLLVGVINGILVIKIGLNSFIATLASGTVLLGITQWLTGDATITGRLPAWFTGFVRDRSLIVPVSFLIVIAIAVCLWLVYEYTSWGRSAHAVGANAQAAALSGINTQLTTFAAFLIAALLAGIAGALSVAVLGASSPTVGLGQLLPAFAAAFLGSTAIRPGRFNALGTLVAVLVLAFGITGLQQLGLDFYVQQLFNGGALLIAITISALARGQHSGKLTGRTG